MKGMPMRRRRRNIVAMAGVGLFIFLLGEGCGRVDSGAGGGEEGEAATSTWPLSPNELELLHTSTLAGAGGC